MAGARRIAIASAPFASTRRPSLQLGLLTSLARLEGWDARALHLSLDFASLIGRDIYELLCQHRGMQLSDWLFSVAAFGDDAPDRDGLLASRLPDVYIRALAERLEEEPGQWLLRVRNTLAPAFARSAALGLAQGGHDIVAFTSTFQQNVASFAIARFLKEVASEITTLFGGANFDDVMGTEFVRGIPWIDYAAIGEGDASFPAFLRAVDAGDDPGAVPGIASRVADDVRHTPLQAPFEALDDLPVPDYSDYFDRGERLGLFGDDPRRQVDLPVEGSRGCWWGAKHHCVFCGLNAGTMKFRAKSPDRFLSEIETLSRRYRSFHIETVDNIIDMRLFEETLGRIATRDLSWNVFFEVKSNLRRAQVEALAAAGVRRVQPGIESLSSPILSLMHKGVKAIQNINLLRWCAHYGIRPSWNLLWGFPGETAAHYDEQTALIPRLVHLQPPDGEGRIWMERFSPLFTQARALGVTAMRPSDSYEQVYPATLDMEKAAYFFDYEMEDALPERTYASLAEALGAWRDDSRSDRHPRLMAYRTDGYTRIEDTRDPEMRGIYDLEGPLAAIHDAFFDGPNSVAAVAKTTGMTEAEIDATVDDFAECGLMMRDGTLAMALALPARAPS